MPTNFKPLRWSIIAYLILIAIVISSCSWLYFFRDIQSIEGMQWKQADIRTFHVEIMEPAILDGKIIIRHVYGFQYDEIPIKLTWTLQDGTTEEMAVMVPIRDANGEYLGEGSVDLWDVEHLAFSDRSFAPGDHTIQIQHVASRDPLPLIMEAGLLLESK